MSITPDAVHLARAAVRKAVHCIIDDRLGAEGFTSLPLFPGSSLTRTDPSNPLDGLRAGVWVRDIANAFIHEYATAARAEGRSWAEVADALGLTEPSDCGTSSGEQAFEWATRGSLCYLTWECATCGQRVEDHGPYYADPQDIERGHAVGCAQWRRAIETYRGEA